MNQWKGHTRVKDGWRVTIHKPTEEVIMSESTTAELSRSRMLDVTAILSFPKLLEPEENLSGRLQYSCVLLFDPEADRDQLERLNAAMTAAAEHKWRGHPPKNLDYPLRDGNEKAYAGYPGRLYLTAKSYDQPVLVAWRNKQPATIEDLVAGNVVIARIAAFGYDVPAPNSRSVLKSGVSFGLNGIWVIRRGERLDGRPSQEFVRSSIGTQIGHQLRIESDVEEAELVRPMAPPQVDQAPLTTVSTAKAATETETALRKMMAGLRKPID
jgi:hypothetical protein